MNKVIDKQYIKEIIEDTVNQKNQFMLTVYARMWESRENLAKNLITLTAAIMVGTITFSGNLLTNTSNGLARPGLLIISWSGFLLSILFGIYSMWQSNTLHSFHARFFNSRPEIKKALDELNAEDEPDKIKEYILQIFKQVSLKVTEPVGKADKRAQYAVIGQMLSFSLALTLFVIFGIYQLK